MLDSMLYPTRGLVTGKPGNQVIARKDRLLIYPTCSILQIIIRLVGKVAVRSGCGRTKSDTLEPGAILRTLCISEIRSISSSPSLTLFHDVPPMGAS
jgi:hypothetical protein